MAIRSPSITTTPATRSRWVRSIWSAETSPARPQSTSRSRSAATPSHCGLRARKAIRIPSSSSRPMTFATFASRITPRRARTSATRCLRAARVSDRNDPKTALLMNQQKQMILTYGQMLGEEVLHVVRIGHSALRNRHQDLRRRQRTSVAPAGEGSTRAGQGNRGNTKTPIRQGRD